MSSYTWTANGRDPVSPEQELVIPTWTKENEKRNFQSIYINKRNSRTDSRKRKFRTQKAIFLHLKIRRNDRLFGKTNKQNINYRVKYIIGPKVNHKISNID